MLRFGWVTGCLVAALAMFPSTASALSCPGAIGGGTGFAKQYTVDPATACVWGVGKINNAIQDDFLTGNGITGHDNGAAILNGFTGGAAAGWSAVDYEFGIDPEIDSDWSIPGYDPSFDYLVGIKNGNSPQHLPNWAVFLVTAGSGTWSTVPQDAWSHGVLYSRPGNGDTDTDLADIAPEPAGLLLLAMGLGLAAFRLRRKPSPQS